MSRETNAVAIPPVPGYAYLMADPSRRWVKVGIAARIGRARDHARQGWTALVRTFGDGDLLADPRGEVERPVLATFTRGTTACPKCDEPKPSIGRSGTDGLTEIAHISCFPGVEEAFRVRWERAERTTLDRRGKLDFDPIELRPGGFEPVREPWHQPPNADPTDYGKNAVNVCCVHGVPPGEVLDVLDAAWERGEVDLRCVLGRTFGERVWGRRGKPTAIRADGSPKGSGASAARVHVEQSLEDTARTPGVDIVFCSVRPLSLLFAYVRPKPRQT